MVRPYITIFSHFYQHNRPCISSQDGLFLFPLWRGHMLSIVIISFSHHKYTPNAHFCQFTFLFTFLIPFCTGFPYLNPFASASLKRSGTGKSQAQKLLPQIRPFQRYYLGVNRTPTSADAPSAQDEVLVQALTVNLFPFFLFPLWTYIHHQLTHIFSSISNHTLHLALTFFIYN